jgi:Protein of unknown function (DUF4240)
MDKTQFWELIESIPQSDDDRVQARHLSNLLRKLNPKVASQFRELFDQMLDKADQESIHEAITKVTGFCSDDGFLYTRAWLISRGRDTFNFVLDNPTRAGDILPTVAYSSIGVLDFERFYAAGSTQVSAQTASRTGEVKLKVSRGVKKATRAKGTQDLNAFVVPGIGAVSIGTKLVHREFGEGVVTAIFPGYVIRALMKFNGRDNDDAYVLLPAYFEPLSKR